MVAKGGPKRALAKALDSDPDKRVLVNGTVAYSSEKGWSMAQLTEYLLRFYNGQIIVDKTGLDGQYRFTLDFSVTPPAAGGPPDVAGEVSAALPGSTRPQAPGDRKEPVEVVVVDHIEEAQRELIGERFGMRVLFILAVAASAGQATLAQEPPPAFRSATRVVEITITATFAPNKWALRDMLTPPVNDLHAADLRLFDNGIEQTIASFEKTGQGGPHISANPEPPPISIIALDSRHTGWVDQIYGPAESD